MRITSFLAAAILAILMSTEPSVAADAPKAKNTVTVFISKGNASAVIKAVNDMHAKMEADGWSYADMSVYVEDGDLAGLFVTYVRAPSAAAAPASN